ncbi:MAG: retropepsin-like aspartic protease, partial [Cyanobacteria bacterium J06553_1]
MGSEDPKTGTTDPEKGAGHKEEATGSMDVVVPAQGKKDTPDPVVEVKPRLYDQLVRESVCARLQRAAETDQVEMQLGFTDFVTVLEDQTVNFTQVTEHYGTQVKVDTSRGLPVVDTMVNGVDASLFIDSGAKVNIIGRRELNRLRVPAQSVRPVNVAIIGVAGKRVKPHGSVMLSFTLADERFVEPFVVLEEVSLPADLLLSYTFLRKHGVMCDWGSNRIYIRRTELSASCETSATLEKEESPCFLDEVIGVNTDRDLTYPRELAILRGQERALRQVPGDLANPQGYDGCPCTQKE